MTYLLDTMAVSALFNPRRHPVVAKLIAGTSDSCFISVITFGEIETGLVAAARHQPEFARRLAAWSAGLQRNYAANILPFDLVTATRWGRLAAELGRRDADLQIAATALVHDLTVVTRNARHFEAAGVRILDPWTV